MFAERPRVSYNPEGTVAILKHGGGSVMNWAAISWYSVGPIITLSGLINVSDYVDILGKRIHPMDQKYRNNDANFQDDSSSIHQPEVLILGFKS